MDSQNLGGLIIFQNVRWSGSFLRLLRNVLIILLYKMLYVICVIIFVCVNIAYIQDQWDSSKIQLAIALGRCQRVAVACKLHVGNPYMRKIAKQQLRREFRKYCAQKWRHKILQTSSFLFYCTGCKTTWAWAAFAWLHGYKP